MARFSCRSIAATVAMAGALAAPLAAHAAVDLVGCAGGSFGPSCGLDELIAGGSMTIGGYSFSNFAVSLAGGRILDASAIRVDAIDQPLRPGFTLTDVGNTLRAVNGDASSNNLGFSVGSVGGSPGVVTGGLMLAVGDVNAVGSYANAFVDLFNAGFTTLLGNLLTYCDSAACANATLASTASFAAMSAISVVAGIDVAAGAQGVGEINAVSVVLTAVPEPATLSLVTLGLGAVAWRRGRKRT